MNAQDIVFRALDEVNADLPAVLAVAKDTDAALLGTGRKIDSLGLMILLSAVERIASDALGRPVRVALEDMDETDTNPLETIGSLIGYVAGRLNG